MKGFLLQRLMYPLMTEAFAILMNLMSSSFISPQPGQKRHKLFCRNLYVVRKHFIITGKNEGRV